MSLSKEINDYLTAQISELEALQSVYPEELVIADHGVLANINNFINNPAQELPHRLEYSIGIPLDIGTIELLVTLPTNYPNEKPEVYARSLLLNRIQQLLLNEALKDVVENQQEGEPCIYMLISWLQDNGESYLIASNRDQGKGLHTENKNKQKQGSIVFARYWVYSHHIYGKCKRRDVANLAKENSITGFCLAGKPGVICMEGASENCEYCWQKIKAMKWQKILIRLLEKQEDCENIDSMREFHTFQEISFPTCERHNDMGQLLKYLTEHKLRYAFKELFGLEGKSTEVSDGQLAIKLL